MGDRDRAENNTKGMMASAVDTVFGIIKRTLGQHQYLGRYSIEKLQLFDQYQRTTSPLRVAAVILLTPIPTALALVMMDVIPMNDPAKGARHNSVAFVRSTISHALMTFFTLLPMKQALSLSDKAYSFRTIALIAVSTSLTIEAVCIPLAFTWRFPVPFREMIGLPIFLGSICCYNYVFARRAMQRAWRRRQLELYVPIVGVQIVLFYFFLGLSIGFTFLPIVPQTVMILTFPFIKMALKQLVWKYAKRLDDISTDVTICMLEVSGALYQTVCMQFVTSYVLSALIIASDVLQALHEVRLYTNLEFLGDGRRTLETALKIVEASVQREEEEETPQPRRGSLIRDGSMGKSVHVDAALIRSRRKRSRRRNLLVLDMVDTDTGVAMPADADDETHQSASILSPKQTTVDAASTAKSVVSSTPMTPAVPTLKLQAKSSTIDAGLRMNQRRATAPSTSIMQRINAFFRPRRRTAVVFSASPIAVDTDWGDDRSTTTETVTNTARSEGPDSRFSRAARYSVESSTYDETGADTDRRSEPPRFPRPSGLTPMYRTRTRIRMDGLVIARRAQARILEQTLQLLFASEVLLFVEYMEVMIPVLYALLVGGEWMLPNAKYNLVVMSMTQASVAYQIWTAFVYALLELATLLVMYWVLRRKYGVSAIYQLSFVLERYWMTLQGKLVGSFIVVFNALTVHQGTDFTLLFPAS